MHIGANFQDWSSHCHCPMSNLSATEANTELLILQWGQLATWWQVGHIRPLPEMEVFSLFPQDIFWYDLSFPHSAPLSEDLQSVWPTSTRSHVVSDRGTDFTGKEVWKWAMTMGSTHHVAQKLPGWWGWNRLPKTELKCQLETVFCEDAASRAQHVHWTQVFGELGIPNRKSK